MTKDITLKGKRKLVAYIFGLIVCNASYSFLGYYAMSKGIVLDPVFWGSLGTTNTFLITGMFGGNTISKLKDIDIKNIISKEKKESK